jgi:hypothetical protein
MAIRITIHLTLAAVRVKRAASISGRRIATRGMAHGKQTESFGRPQASAILPSIASFVTQGIH